MMLSMAPPTTVPGDPLGTVAQDPDQVRQRACDIVSSSPLACTTNSPKPPSAPTHHDLGWLTFLAWLLLLAVVVVLLVVVVRAIAGRPRGERVRRRRRRHIDEPADEIELGVVAIDRSREPFDWRAEAEAHRRAGRYRDAVRCRYRALVGDLARMGLIDEIPGRTTGEERQQLREVVPTASTAFEAAADLFDDAWYGHAAIDGADDDRFQVLEAGVLASTAATSVGAR